MDVELARQQWDDGRRRVERAQPGSAGVARGSRPRSTSSWRSSAAASARRSRSRELARRVRWTRVEWARDSLYDARPEGAPPPDTSDRHRRGVPAVRPRRGRLPPVTLGRTVAVVAGAVVVFAAGIGLGQALDDNETDGSDTQTLVRTLDPLSLAARGAHDVTVTTTAEP